MQFMIASITMVSYPVDKAPAAMVNESSERDAIDITPGMIQAGAAVLCSLVFWTRIGAICIKSKKSCERFWKRHWVNGSNLDRKLTEFEF